VLLNKIRTSQLVNYLIVFNVSIDTLLVILLARIPVRFAVASVSLSAR